MVVAAATAGAALLGGCGVLGREAAQTPIPLSSAWHPGLFVDGYGPSGLGPSPTATASGSAAPSAAPSDSTLADPTQAALASVLLRAGDLPTGLTLALDVDGTSLAKPSLTYCSVAYPSEAQREARRRQVVQTTSGTGTGLATEAVLYRTAADAAAALDELRAAAAACPSPRRVTSGTSTLTFTAVPSSDVDTTGLVPETDRVMASSTVDDGTGAPYRLTRLWQRRGRVLVGLYYSGATIAPGSSATFTATDLSNVRALGDTLAERLDALDPAVVGASASAAPA